MYQDHTPENNNSEEHLESKHDHLPHIPSGVDAGLNDLKSNYIEHASGVEDRLITQFKDYMDLLGATSFDLDDQYSYEAARKIIQDIATIFSHFEPRGLIADQDLFLETLEKNITPEGDVVVLMDATCGMRSVVLDMRRDPEENLHAFFEVLESPAYHLLLRAEEEKSIEVIPLFSQSALDEIVDNLYKVKTYLENNPSVVPRDYTEIMVPSRVFTLTMNDVLDFNDRRNALSGGPQYQISNVLDVNFWKEGSQYKVHLEVEVSQEGTFNRTVEDHYFLVGLGKVGELVIMRDGYESGANSESEAA